MRQRYHSPNHCKIAKACPEYISLVVEVSSCFLLFKFYLTKGRHPKKSIFLLDIVQKWPRPSPPHFGHP